MSPQEQNNSGGRGQGSGCKQTNKHKSGQGGNTQSKFRGQQTNGVLKDLYICIGDGWPSQFSKLEKALPSYALSRKQTKVAMILITKRPLGIIKDFIDAYPTGADANNKATVKIWEQKAKGQQKEFQEAKKGQQDMITVILGQCNETTWAQVEADEEFGDILDEGRILDFIRILRAVCYDTSALGSLFQPIHSIDQLKHLLRFDNQANNMYDFVDGVKNRYASAKAAGYKFSMGTASLMHLLKIDNPNADNNQALWDIYIEMEAEDKTAIELRAENHDIAVLALHNSCMPQAIHEYATSYMWGNQEAYPTTAEAVARNLTDNYKVILRNNQKLKKKPTNQSNEEELSETAGEHVQENVDENQGQGTQGAHIIVNNESSERKSYTIDQMLDTHPINHPIWNLNSTMSDEEEDVHKEDLLQKIDHMAITDTDQDFQSGRR